VKRLTTLLILLGLMSGCRLNFSSIGSWSVETPPPAPISTSAVVPLADGRVLLLGGFNQQSGQATSQVLIFDPRRNVWESGAPMPEPVGYGAVVARLHNETVLVAGGQGANGPVGDTWLYEPGANAWSRAGSLHEARYQPSFAVLTDGRVLVVGGSIPLAQPIQLATGETVNEQVIASAEIFDPGTKAWSQAGQLSSGRIHVSLVALPGGAALAAGGCSGASFQGGAISKVELFEPTGHWIRTTSLPEPRCGSSGLALKDGRAFVVGGSSDTGSLPGALTFDPRNHRWTSLGTVGDQSSIPILLADGRVLLPEVQTGPVQGRVLTAFVGGQIFDPAAGDWTYVTTTAVPLSSIYLQQGGTSLPVSLPTGDAIVLLQTVVLAFHPDTSPPAPQILDSSGLAILLSALASFLGLLLAIGYVVGTRRGASVT
jgi:hypothetical protein